MEASFCLRELVEKMFQSRSSTILTPLERFLSSTSNIFKPACHASEGGDLSSLHADGAVSLFNTIGAVPSGILFNNYSSINEGLVSFGGKSLAILSIDKMHANTSFSSPSSSSNSTTVPVVNNIIKGQWTAEEDRFEYDKSDFAIFPYKFNQLIVYFLSAYN
jgi:hypothetical protein